MGFEIALWLTKFVHVTAIALWASGLISIPFLLRQRSSVTGDEEHRLHRLVRFLFVGFVSPAAFVAVGSGTVLIFLRETFVEWFSAKLVAVGALVIIHVITGLLVLKLFSTDGELRFGWPRTALLTLCSLTAVAAVLWLVLAKPDWTAETQAALFTPGGLRDALLPLIASVTR
ncbi:CopD family protein [Plastorhodobacter daqingensis]|uniref:CopD family protein n=1 Tax=Plastorhodobacter daqingensis TaxID=1387281 RepID=A0ABW2UMJ1_9RHOB